MRESFALRGAVLLACVLVSASMAFREIDPPRRMSFHNRLLWNRAALSGLRTLEAMVIVRNGGFTGLSALIERLGGRMRRVETAVGYARVEVPTETLLDLADSSDIEAFQISSLSHAGWYRDGASERIANMYRGLETASIGTSAAPNRAGLPPLTVARSREPGYTADDDVGIGRWMKAHPTFDGRGVTIALLESAQPEFSHPVMDSGTALDGSTIPKLAGILDTIGLDEPDDTRVDLSTDVSASSAWVQIGGRTYVMPHAGTFRFGLFTLPAGANVVHQFGVIEDRATREVFVDTNGNADFQDEKPIADVNERFDVRSLKLLYPRAMEVSFVMSHGAAPRIVHLYLAKGDHQTMTLSVAAGTRTDDGLAYGVAPGARVLLVRHSTSAYRLRDIIEGYLDAIARPDVDVLCDSEGVMPGPDTSADFVALFFTRLVNAYRKPIFRAAGNVQSWLSAAVDSGDAFSVGGSLGPQTFAAFYGGATVPAVMVHHAGAAGPSLDGGIKPDFLAPMERVSAALWSDGPDGDIPKNSPAFELPRGYEISCCTSASSPYAAGVAALLISGAKQQHLPYPLDRLARALRVGARFLPGWPSYQQGNGVLDVELAWRELTSASVDIPRIRTSGVVVHPLTPYSANGARGESIFERSGWIPGMTGRRVIEVRRESGPLRPVEYRLSWTGHDGTFSAPAAISLPLNTSIELPVAIRVNSAGVHSAILNLHDARDAIVFRRQATIVASEPIDPQTHRVRLTGSVPLMQTRDHYVDVPAGTKAIVVELEVVRGSMTLTMLPGNGLLPLYSPLANVYPEFGRTFVEGRHVLIVPTPVAGTWAIDIANTSARRERNQALVRTTNAEYVATVKLVSASVEARAVDRSRISIDVRNTGASLGDPRIETSIGRLGRFQSQTLPTGLPNTFNIDVASGMSALTVRLDADDVRAEAGMELYLYDCTTGECFLHDFTIPAAEWQTLTVRSPRAGRWIAAVNSAPFPRVRRRFTIETVVVTGPARHQRQEAQTRPPGARWSVTVDVGSLPRNRDEVVCIELVDRSIEEDAAAHEWENRPGIPKWTARPIAGTAVYRN